MVRNITPGKIIPFVLLFCGMCSHDASVRLSLEFSTAQTWRYAVDARVSGTVGAQTTGRTFESAVQCTLLGAPDLKKNTLLHVTVTPQPHFSSNILNEVELENLVSQAREIRLSCNPGDGMIVPDDTSEMPMIRIGEWDVFQDIVKTLPSLPKIRVKPGATWDREKTIPLSTRHGDAAGHLIQSFCLDSVYPGPAGKKNASISWKFSYRLELRGADNPATAEGSGIIARMPQKGSGTGHALINISDKALENASMSFSVPLSSEGSYRISWNETISLRRIN